MRTILEQSDLDVQNVVGLERNNTQDLSKYTWSIKTAISDQIETRVHISSFN